MSIREKIVEIVETIEDHKVFLTDDDLLEFVDEDDMDYAVVIILQKLAGVKTGFLETIECRFIDQDELESVYVEIEEEVVRRKLV